MRWVEREVSSALNTPDDTSRYEAELIALENEITRVVDAIARVDISPALEAKLQELEHNKVESEIALESTRRVVPVPERSEVHGIWTEMVEGLGELPKKLTDTDLQAVRTAIKGLVGEIRVDQDGNGYADVCLQCMVAPARIVR